MVRGYRVFGGKIQALSDDWFEQDPERLLREAARVARVTRRVEWVAARIAWVERRVEGLAARLAWGRRRTRRAMHQRTQIAATSGAPESAGGAGVVDHRPSRLVGDHDLGTGAARVLDPRELRGVADAAPDGLAHRWNPADLPQPGAGGGKCARPARRGQQHQAHGSPRCHAEAEAEAFHAGDITMDSLPA